ncbi:deoxyribodipyrimidine photo-lyase [Spirochaeta dissipatitropha]
MQSSVRSHWNPALERAIIEANKQNLPLLVVFVLTKGFMSANVRHYAFLLEGLRETFQELGSRNITLHIVSGNPPDAIVLLSRYAEVCILDQGYLRIHRDWYSQIRKRISKPIIQIESNTVLPVRTAYPKEAYSAGIIRPKIHALWGDYLEAIKQYELTNHNLPDVKSLYPELEFLSESDLEDKLMDTAAAHASPGSISISSKIKGGELQAERRLHIFIEQNLGSFADDRNDPSLEGSSILSPYLHYGMISPLRIALEARDRGSGESVDVLWEELIVRRELSCNFTEYNGNYDNPECLPDWALKTLHKHNSDPREYLYTYEELEQAATHDKYWNAAQNQMRILGWMHGYMRMYWGKKVIEWSPDFETAYERLIRLNDDWELDGRDPNGYAGVAWCFGKHDRAWQERPVFGKIRYMNDSGLKRKFNIDAYADKWTQTSASDQSD